MTAQGGMDDVVLNSRWATTIGAVCDRFGGEVQTGPFGSQLHASDYIDTGIPVVMPQDMKDGTIVCDRIARVDSSHVERLSQHKLRVGDVVFSRRGDVGRFAVVTEREQGWLCGTGSIRIRLNSPDVHVGFVRQYLQQDVVGQWLMHHAKGVTMPNLNTGVIKALPFVYPPLDEQRRIADILDRADALRTKRRAALALLDTLTQSIFLDMFGDPVTNDRGWPQQCLADVGAVITGNTPSRANPTYYDGPLEWIKSDNLNSPFYFATSASETLSAEGRTVARVVPPNAVLVTCIAGSPSCIGNAAMVDREVAFNQQINALVVRQGDPHFFYGQLVVGKRLVQNASTASMKGMVNKSRFESIRVIVPPIAIQRDFARRALAVEDLKSQHRASLAELDALFASLQHRAFRGEL